MSIKLILIYFLIILSSCGKQEGSGVLVEPEISDPKIDIIIPEIPVDPPVSTILTVPEVQDLINNANPNDSIIINKDFVITETLTIDKPVNFISKDGERQKITIANVDNPIIINSNNVGFENFDFELIDVKDLFNTPLGGNERPLYENLLIKNSIFYLKGKSNLRLAINSLKIEKSTIFGLAENPLLVANKPMVTLIGDNINFLGNMVIDITDNYIYPILVLSATDVRVKRNIIKGKSENFEGLLTLNSVNGADIERNFFTDKSSNRSFFADEENTILVSGTIAISSSSSMDIKDNNNINTIATTNQILDAVYPFSEDFDNIPIDSYNSSLFDIFLNDPIRNNTIDNFGFFEDSSIFKETTNGNIKLNCQFPSNKALSDINIEEWNVLNLDEASNSKIYYAGAIPPKCLN